MKRVYRWSIIAVILLFTLWFVWTMAFNPLDFNYYSVKGNYVEGDLREDIAHSKAEMMENLKEKHIIHYFILKNQFWIFIIIAVFFFPTKKIKALVKKLS